MPRRLPVNGGCLTTLLLGVPAVLTISLAHDLFHAGMGLYWRLHGCDYQQGECGAFRYLVRRNKEEAYVEPYEHPHQERFTRPGSAR